MILDDINRARLKAIQYQRPIRSIEVHPETYIQIAAELSEFRIVGKKNKGNQIKFIGQIFGMDVYENPNVSEGEIRILK